jgi:hypothetical protein
MVKTLRLRQLTSIILLLILMLASEPAYAQWPPFYFRLIPSYEDGKLIYNFTFSSKVDWMMTDLAIKVPLPEGTSFLETNTNPRVDVDFDGTEVTFFVSAFTRKIREGDVFVALEVTDPTKTIFTTRAWITWQGNQPGDYLTKDVSIDITRQSLSWEAPAKSRLEVDLVAKVVDGVITYFLYPANLNAPGGVRMQDLKISVPIPEGTTFLSAEAPSPFVASFDGREVSFSTLELEPSVRVEPLKFRVSAEGVVPPFITARGWATWKNVGVRVARSVAAQEENATREVIVQPGTSQWVVADEVGDVPFADYDVTSIALKEVTLPEQGRTLKVIFYTAGDLGLIGKPLDYIFYIDSDCRIETGSQDSPRGAEYRVRYRHKVSRALIRVWDDAGEDWKDPIKVNSLVGDKMLTLWVPYDLLGDDREFCWVVEIKNRTTTFQRLPAEKVPDRKDSRLTQYQALEATAEIETEIETFTTEPSDEMLIDFGDVWQYLPGWSAPPSTWMSIDFDDTGWFSGPTSIGYGDHTTDLSLITPSLQDDIAPLLVERTDSQSGVIMAVLPSGDDVTSVFMRRAFTIANPVSLSQLTLEVEYEGGFVVYLNGVEVARRGLGAPGSTVSYDTLAAAPDPEVETVEVIDLSSQITNLVAGVNVLAIQAHKSSSDANLSINPRVIWEFNPINTPVDISPQDDSEAFVSTPPIIPQITDIKGKLAVPLDNGRAAYDVHVFSLPDGQETAKLPNARQPNFRYDGQRMLINREGGGIENIYEYNLADGTEKQVSDAPQDWHPFYDPWGNRVVYGNSELAVGSPEWVIDESGRPRLIGIRKPFIFVQCGLLPPHQETEPRCRDIPTLGVLVPASQTGEIQGMHPVWTASDMIAYQGCNTWAGSQLCGIYIVPSSSTKGFSDGFIPRQLTRHTSDTPSDTKGNLIAFTSQRDGDWEAYVMDLNGNGVKNLSNSPNSNDGLSTISPDGNWVAFVSDREGHWAVWVVPVAGGSAQKLFDLPTNIPWGDGNRAWINERISWGP